MMEMRVRIPQGGVSIGERLSCYRRERHREGTRVGEKGRLRDELSRETQGTLNC